MHLLETVGAQEPLDGWKGQKEYKRLYDHAKFFARKEIDTKAIDTFDELAVWLQDEKNRDSLTTAGLGIRDRTADYYRVLAGLPDAVKVDNRVKKFLINAGIDVTKYAYKELRTIVQLAAKQLGKRPIDLDSAIWNYQGGGKRDKERGESMSHEKKAGDLKRGWMKEVRDFCRSHNLAKECGVIEDMDWPSTWHLKKKGPGGRPEAEFRWAVQGNFELMLEKKGITVRPEKWPAAAPPRWGKALKTYLTVTEGINWQNTLHPPWVGAPVTQPPPSTITISLSADQKNQLENLAVEWGIDEPTLARIWILERLRHLD